MVAIAHVAGSDSALFALLGAVVCFALRLAGLHFRLDAPVPAGARQGDTDEFERLRRSHRP